MDATIQPYMLVTGARAYQCGRLSKGSTGIERSETIDEGLQKWSRGEITPIPGVPRKAFLEHLPNISN